MQTAESPIQTLAKITAMVKGAFDGAFGRGEVKTVEEAGQINAGFQMISEGLNALRAMELKFEQRSAERLAKAKEEQDAERAASDAAIDQMPKGDVIPMHQNGPVLKLVKGGECNDCDPKPKA